MLIIHRMRTAFRLTAATACDINIVAKRQVNIHGGLPKRAIRSGRGQNLASVQRAEDFGHRNRGRLRAPPAADKASNKEWPRSKSCERIASRRFRAPQQDITGRSPSIRQSGFPAHLLQFHFVVISRQGVNIHGGLPKRAIRSGRGRNLASV